MIQNKALKCRIYPNEMQKKQIDTTLNCCRFIYNSMLNRNTKVYERRKEHLSYYEMQNILPKMKGYLPWLKEADSQALQYSCRQLNDSFARFFKKQGKYPNFKHKKDNRQSYTNAYFPSLKYENGKIKIPTLGWMKLRDDRKPQGEIKRVTISRENNKYYVSVLCEYEQNIQPITVNSDKVLGLDYKSDGIYTDSFGNILGSPKYYREAQVNLKRKQKRLSKMEGSKKGQKKSKNYLKQLKTIRNIHEHIANQRKDFLHKKSTQIANEYDAVCIENLNLKNIANCGYRIGKATADNGFGMFTTMLDYKLQGRGKKLIKVDKFYPSTKTCSVCGNIQSMKLKDRVYHCSCCGNTMDRDYNAAVNIRNEGLRQLNAS